MKNKAKNAMAVALMEDIADRLTRLSFHPTDFWKAVGFLAGGNQVDQTEFLQSLKAFGFSFLNEEQSEKR